MILRHATPLVVADNNRRSCNASSAVETLLGVSSVKVVDRPLDDFVESSFKPRLKALWQTVLEKGEKAGTLPLIGEDGSARMVEFEAKGNVLPARHVVILCDQGFSAGKAGRPSTAVRDFALFLLDVNGRITGWQSGAVRIYGYRADEVEGRPESQLYPKETNPGVAEQDRLGKVAREEHSGDEGWQCKKDGSQFWANTITMALRNDDGILQGFARVVRDFSERHQHDETLRRSRALQAMARTPVAADETFQIETQIISKMEELRALTFANVVVGATTSTWLRTLRSAVLLPTISSNTCWPSTSSCSTSSIRSRSRRSCTKVIHRNGASFNVAVATSTGTRLPSLRINSFS